MDLNSRLIILALLFTGCVTTSLGEIESHSSDSNDDWDEFDIFVQTFLAHLLNSDVFTKSEKEDLKAIVYTVETVITAPRRRETDLLRKMQIFDVAVVSAIAETIGIDSDGVNSTITKKKASAIAKALIAAFNTVSADKSSNEQLLSEINSMVNMFARLEHQEGASSDTSSSSPGFKASESAEPAAISDRSKQAEPALYVVNEQPIPAIDFDIENVPPNSNTSEEEPLPMNQPAVLAAEDDIQANTNEETVPAAPDIVDDTDWNFVFCLYNELFSASLFSEIFSNTLEFPMAQTYIQRISSGLSKTLFQSRLSEYDIFNSLSKALLHLSPAPTTEEFAFMFGHELSKMLYSQGMFDQYDPCALSASVASAIIENIKSPSETLSTIPPIENPSLTPQLSNSTTASGSNKTDSKQQIDFQPKLLDKLLSSEIFYVAFPNEITRAKLKDYAYAVGSFIPAIPEYKSLNYSILSSAIAETLQSVYSRATPDKYAGALASVIATFMENNSLLDVNNLDKQVSRIGTIVLNALSTQIPAKTRTRARKPPENSSIPNDSSQPRIKKKSMNNTFPINGTNEIPSKPINNSLYDANFTLNGSTATIISPDASPISTTTRSSDIVRLDAVTYATTLDESYDLISEATETTSTPDSKTDEYFSTTDSQNLDFEESSISSVATTTEKSNTDVNLDFKESSTSSVITTTEKSNTDQNLDFKESSPSSVITTTEKSNTDENLDFKDSSTSSVITTTEKSNTDENLDFKDSSTSSVITTTEKSNTDENLDFEESSTSSVITTTEKFDTDENLDSEESSTSLVITTTEKSDTDGPGVETTTITEPGTTAGDTSSSTDLSTSDEVTTSDDNSTPFTRFESFFESTTKTTPEKEAAIKQLQEEINQAVRSGTTETLVRALAAVVTEAYNNPTLETTITEPTGATTENISGTADGQFGSTTGSPHAETETTVESFGTTKIDESREQTSSVETTTDATSALNSSPEVSTYSTTTVAGFPKNENTSSEVSSKAPRNRERIKKSLSDIYSNPLIDWNPTKKNTSQLMKSPTWLFESALSYSLLSSEKFTASFKPETSPSDAKSLAFSMAEAVANVPPLDFPGSVFVLGHSFYTTVHQMLPNSTAEDYAKAFANATAEVVLERDLLTKENQISLAIAAGNAIHDSLSDEQPQSFKSYLHKKIKPIMPKPFELGEDASTSAFLEELLSTLSNGDTETKQEILSQTLSDIGAVLGNKHLKPKTILIKLLMEALVAAVNVIISDSSE